MYKNLIKSSLMCLLLIFITGCAEKNATSNTPKKQNTVAEQVQNTEATKVGFQLEQPQKDEEIAIFKTNMGNFKVRFFPEEAPKAVESFKKHAENNYYNNQTFHRIIADFMIQSGDPKGNGTGGESIWEKPFEDEFSPNLFNITGALSMANAGPNTNGSQFFINNQSPDKFMGWEKIKNNGSVDMKKITDEIKNLYIKNGGNPTLDGWYSITGRGHTVFGQIFEGMDTINKISLVKTDENDKPVNPVIIEKITIEKA